MPFKDKKKTSEYNKQYKKDNPDIIRKHERARKITSARLKQIRTKGERYRDRYPERGDAKYQVREAIRKGILHKPNDCSKCNKRKNIQGHHPDYNKPLEVIWLCQSCHIELHVCLKVKSA